MKGGTWRRNTEGREIIDGKEVEGKKGGGKLEKKMRMGWRKKAVQKDVVRGKKRKRQEEKKGKEMKEWLERGRGKEREECNEVRG